jgi:hypothetical protein
VRQVGTRINFSFPFAPLKIILIEPYINFLFDLVFDQRFAFILLACLLHYTAHARFTRHNLTPPTSLTSGCCNILSLLLAFLRESVKIM